VEAREGGEDVERHVDAPKLRQPQQVFVEAADAKGPRAGSGGQRPGRCDVLDRKGDRVKGSGKTVYQQRNDGGKRNYNYHQGQAPRDELSATSPQTRPTPPQPSALTA
jgi:hypothetical protein